MTATVPRAFARAAKKVGVSHVAVIGCSKDEHADLRTGSRACDPGGTAAGKDRRGSAARLIYKARSTNCFLTPCSNEHSLRDLRMIVAGVHHRLSWDE